MPGTKSGQTAGMPGMDTADGRKDMEISKKMMNDETHHGDAVLGLLK